MYGLGEFANFCYKNTVFSLQSVQKGYIQGWWVMQVWVGLSPPESSILQIQTGSYPRDRNVSIYGLFPILVVGGSIQISIITIPTLVLILINTSVMRSIF